MSQFLLLMTTLTVLVTSAGCQPVDSTVIAGSSGTAVVEAVVDLIRSKCLFSSDRLFLRRLAYVESRDGLDPNTYRPGYDGGIWQVDQSMFNTIVSCPILIRSYCNIIQREFSINWPIVTWSDLRKPLYSGLAATLYIIYQLGGNTTIMPATLSGQEYFWGHKYHTSPPAGKNFTQLANEATKFECDIPMDIAFIIDSSGSIVDRDFNLSINFIADVVEALPVPNIVRVAALIFDDVATVKFNFSTYTSKSQVLTAIRTMQRSTGLTATNVALDLARTAIFPTARSDIKHVAVLITDGQSNSFSRTSQSARALKNSGVTILAIGVGGYNLAELMDVASDPKCLNVFTLTDFSVIDSIVYEIQESTCKAIQTISEVGNFTSHLNITIVPTPPSANKTVQISVKCGTLEVYVSYSNPNPSPVLYSEKYTGSDERPIFLEYHAENDGLPVYMSIVGTEVQVPGKNCTGLQYHVSYVDVGTEVKCCDGSVCRECSLTDLRQDPRFSQVLCNIATSGYQTPCLNSETVTSGRIIYPYPFNSSKFIRCDYQGRTYITLCPDHQLFNPNTLACGYQTPGFIERTPLPTSYTNPCTISHIQAQYFFFPYTPDSHMFIHCDPWGNAWLMSCPALEVWDQTQLTCTFDHPTIVFTTKQPITVVNPCTPENMAQGRLFHPYPCDHTRYIHCDVRGNYYVQVCPGGLYYDPTVFICREGNPQHSGVCEV